MRQNDVIPGFANRLSAVGNPFKAAVTAAMRKRLIILNIVLKTDTPGRNDLCAARNENWS